MITLRGIQQGGRIKRGRGQARKTKDVEEVEHKEHLHCDMDKSQVRDWLSTLVASLDKT